MTNLQTIAEAFATNDGLYQITGPFDDLTMDDNGVGTQLIALTKPLAEQGYGVVTYQLSEGTHLYADHLEEETRDRLVAAQNRHNLTATRPLATTIRGLARLLREPVKIVVLVLDAANCFPATERHFLSEDDRALREHVSNLGGALWLQKSGNVLALIAEPGTIDATIETAAARITLTPPGEEEKEALLDALSPLYPNARFDDDISPQAAARLMSGTTNRATEALLRRAHHNGTPITARQLNDQKQEALLARTRGVLRLLDTTGLPALVGNYLKPALQVLATFFTCLLKGDRNASPLLIIHGPPGVGKTLAAKWAAATASVLVLELQSQRASLVGESEERSRIFHESRLETAFTPNAVFTDENAHMPTSRDGNDSGVSATLFSDWLSALADPRYRGQSLIIATTNVPEHLPAAMQSRAEFLPVFSPSIEDLASILAHRCTELGLEDDGSCTATAQRIASKGGSPRDLDRMLRKVAREHHQPCWNDINTAAENLLVPDSQWHAALYCDYWSLLTMSDKTSIPWTDRAVMPAHLAAVIDDDLTIDCDQVRARLEELGPVNV